MAATNNTDCYRFYVHMILRVEVAVMFSFEYCTLDVVSPSHTVLLLLFCLTVMVLLLLFFTYCFILGIVSES